MSFDNYLFRCSALGYLMVEPQAKKDKEAGHLSKSTKKHLIDIFVSERYGRQSDVTNKYIEKGLMVEEDSITLYSRVKKQFFKKNEAHLNDVFIKGTPDLYKGTSIVSANEVIDLKSSWDIFTFNRNRCQDINEMYYWQLQGYMALTGAKCAKLAYCLVNTPQILIDDEKRKLFYRMNAATTENDDYMEACLELEKQMVFDDIPMDERIIEFELEANEVAMKLLYSRIERCRLFLNELEQTFLNTNKIAA